MHTYATLTFPNIPGASAPQRVEETSYRDFFRKMFANNGLYFKNFGVFFDSLMEGLLMLNDNTGEVLRNAETQLALAKANTPKPGDKTKWDKTKDLWHKIVKTGFFQKSLGFFKRMVSTSFISQLVMIFVLLKTGLLKTFIDWAFPIIKDLIIFVIRQIPKIVKWIWNFLKNDAPKFFREIFGAIFDSIGLNNDHPIRKVFDKLSDYLPMLIAAGFALSKLLPALSALSVLSKVPFAIKAPVAVFAALGATLYDAASAAKTLSDANTRQINDTKKAINEGKNLTPEQKKIQKSLDAGYAQLGLAGGGFDSDWDRVLTEEEIRAREKRLLDARKKDEEMYGKDASEWTRFKFKFGGLFGGPKDIKELEERNKKIQEQRVKSLQKAKEEWKAMEEYRRKQEQDNLREYGKTHVNIYDRIGKRFSNFRKRWDDYWKDTEKRQQELKNSGKGLWDNIQDAIAKNPDRKLGAVWDVIIASIRNAWDKLVQIFTDFKTYGVSMFDKDKDKVGEIISQRNMLEKEDSEYAKWARSEIEVDQIKNQSLRDAVREVEKRQGDVSRMDAAAAARAGYDTSQWGVAGRKVSNVSHQPYTKFIQGQDNATARGNKQ